MLCCLIGCFSPHTYAAGTEFSISPGAAFSKQSSSQTLLLLTSPQRFSNQYIANNSWEHAFALRLFLGRSIFEHKKFLLNAGFSLGYIQDLTVQGGVNQFALSDFDNLNYQYQQQSAYVLGLAKLHYMFNSVVWPYLSIGAGGSRNRTYDYTETPRIEGAVAMAPFSNNSNQSFAYDFGVGITLNPASAFTFGIGYDFLTLGKTALGISPAQQTNDLLSVKSFNVNQVLINISWLA